MDKETTDKLCIDFFTKLFEVGNSIRGWTGQGPYVPLDQRPPYQHFDSLAAPRMIAFSDLRSSLPADLQSELDNLPLYDYNNGEFSPHKGNQTINQLYNDLVEGRGSCFVASSVFIVTAVYYLQHRYNYTLPNVDLNTLKFFC